MYDQIQNPSFLSPSGTAAAPSAPCARTFPETAAMTEREAEKQVQQAARRMREDYLRQTEGAVRYLKRLCEYFNEVNDLTARCEKYREFAARATAALGGTGTHKGGNGTENNLLALLSAQEELGARIENLMGKIREAETVIRLLPSDGMRRVLLLRYVDNRTWPEVQSLMNYSERGVMRLHREAILFLSAMESLGRLKSVLPDGFSSAPDRNEVSA